MSMLECNLASGDGGANPAFQKPSVKRTPVPSCRKFATRHQPKSDNAKSKIQDALRQVSTTPKAEKFSRKRAQTMAEITPSKKKSIDLKLAGDVPTKTPLRKEDAARRVYQQLLLNAWRRRKAQVASFSESSKRLQAQVDQLQIQVNVLQDLRKSESQKRNEATNETIVLRKELEASVKMMEKLKVEKAVLKSEVDQLQRKIECLVAEGENMKNELLSSRSDITAYEDQLSQERQKTVKLLRERENLNKKIIYYEGLTAEQVDTIYQLRESMDSMETNLMTANNTSSILKEDKSDLSLKLEKESSMRSDVERQYALIKRKEELLERRVQELRKNVAVLSDTKRKLMEDNANLKQTLNELEFALKLEQDKKWWKNAADMILESIQSAAHIMLPALPTNTSVTSTDTDAKQES